MRHCCRENKIM